MPSAAPIYSVAATDGLYDNSVRRDAGRQDRAVARRRHYSIRRYHDEQHAANSPNSATNNDVGECWLNARCSDRHVDWNGLYPASGLYIN
jgi:hypothetical protein